MLLTAQSEGARVLTFGIPDDPADTALPESRVLSGLQLTASVTSGVHVQGFASYKILRTIAQVKTLPYPCLGLIVDTCMTMVHGQEPKHSKASAHCQYLVWLIDFIAPFQHLQMDITCQLETFTKPTIVMDTQLKGTYGCSMAHFS